MRRLLVIDGHQLVGVLSDCDLDRTLLAMSVKDAMTSRVFTITPETLIRRAARLLRDHRISCLLVVDDGRVVGILTTSDLLDLIAGELPDDRSPPPRTQREPDDART